MNLTLRPNAVLGVAFRMLVVATLMLGATVTTAFAQCAGNESTLSITITFDNFAAETSFQVNDAAGGVICDFGPFTPADNATTQTFDCCIPCGECVSFTINDAFGDGICCAFGPGTYSVSIDGGPPIPSPTGGAFGVTETIPDLCAAPCPAAGLPDRVSGTEKGSLLVFSKVEIRWDAAGNVIQDTFLDITNDWIFDTGVKLYLINGDPPLAANGAERAHPGWNSTDLKITLTANQPAFWSALTGQPGPGGGAVSPFTILDSSANPLQQGRPAPDGSGERVLRGYVYAWACNTDGCQVGWDHLKGDATLVNYQNGSAWEYNAWAFQSANAAGQAPVQNPAMLGAQCGRISLDGVTYVAPYGLLLLDFYATGSLAFTGGNPLQTITNETDLTLHPVDADLRQESHGPYTTKATFTVWNENETQFTGLDRCITCWDQTLLGQYAPAANHFLLANLQTDKGKARIDGLASTLCSSNCCIDRNITDNPGAHPGCASPDCQELVCQVDSSCCSVEWDADCVWAAINLCDECDGPNDATPLLGVHAKHLMFNGVSAAAAGGNLIGMGTEPTEIRYDAVTGGGGPPPSVEPDISGDPATGARVRRVDGSGSASLAPGSRRR